MPAYLIYLIASWFDHVRDLLHMVNHFRSEMPMPLVGIGHSMGGNQLVNLALIHPRLLSTLVLLDPVIQEHASAPSGPNPAQASTFRRDIWPSRHDAETLFRKQAFYQSWDPRVLDCWIKYGVRETPTLVHPGKKGASNTAVTLTTSKHQEVFTFLRPSWSLKKSASQVTLDSTLLPDIDLSGLMVYPFYRPEPPLTLSRLPNLRPSVLYIFGELSNMSGPAQQEQKLAVTGTGVGGSGGRRNGRVKGVELKGIGHLVAMESVHGCADQASDWLSHEMQLWKAEADKYEAWSKLDIIEKVTTSKEWESQIGGPIRRPVKAKI